jgi:hypothetical protein
MRIGGPGGFSVDTRAEVTITKYMSTLAIEAVHEGGWSPIQGPLASMLTTPAFSGKLIFGPGSRVSIDFEANYLQPIKIGKDVITISGTDVANSGMSFTVHAFRPDGYGLASPLETFEMGFYGRLQIGPTGSAFAVPPLVLTGRTRWEDSSTSPSMIDLQISTLKPWRPIESMPWLVLPTVRGSVRMDSSGMVEASIEHDPIWFTFPGSILRLRDWRVGIPSLRFSLTDATMQPELELIADGFVDLSFTGSFEDHRTFTARVAGYYSSQANRLRLAISHDGGLRPFDGLQFVTPAMEGVFIVDGDGLRAATMYQLHEALPLFGGLKLGPGNPERISALGLSSLSTDGLGPFFALEVRLPRNLAGGFDAFHMTPGFFGSLCMMLTAGNVLTNRPTCGWLDLLEVVGRPLVYTLSFQITGGGVQPLAGLPGLPIPLQQSVTILASKTTPFLLAMTLALTPGSISLTFEFAASVALHLPMLHIHHCLLDIGAAGGISEEGGLQGAFAISMRNIWLPDFLGGPIAGAAVALATADGFRVQYGGTMAPIRKGLSIFWIGTAPFFTLCFDLNGWGTVRMEFYLASLTSIGGMVSCHVDWSATFLPFNVGPLRIDPLGNINLVRFGGLEISFEAGLTGSSTGYVQGSVGARFEIATGSAMCDSSGAAGSHNPECLRSYVSSQIIITVGPPMGVAAQMDFETTTEGVWFEPFYLRNVAIINPTIGIGVKLQPDPVVYVLVTPSTVFFNLQGYWKVKGEWPQNWYSMDEWPPTVALGQDTLQGIEVNLYWECVPHDDPILSALGLPKIGVIFAMYNFQFSRLPNFLVDVGMSFVEVATELFGVGIPAAFAFPAWVAQTLPLKLDFKGEVSIIDDPKPFGKQLYVEGTIKDFDMFVLAFTTCAGVSVVTGGIGMLLIPFICLLPPGVVFIDFGMYFSMPVTQDAVKELISDPVGTIMKLGFGLSASVHIPPALAFIFDAGDDLARITLKGKVTPFSFELAGDVTLNILGFKYAGTLFWAYDLTTLSMYFGLSMHVSIPLFGMVYLEGSIGIMSGLPSVSLKGSVDVAMMGGFCMVGHVSVSSAELSFSTDVTMGLGLLGTFHLRGKAAPDGFDMFGSIEASPGEDPLAGLKRLMMEAIVLLLESEVTKEPVMPPPGPPQCTCTLFVNFIGPPPEGLVCQRDSTCIPFNTGCPPEYAECTTVVPSPPPPPPPPHPIRIVLETLLALGGSTGKPLHLRYATLHVRSEGRPALRLAAGINFMGQNSDFDFSLDGFGLEGIGRRQRRNLERSETAVDATAQSMNLHLHDELHNSTRPRAVQSAGRVEHVGLHDQHGRRTAHLPRLRRLQAANACGGSTQAPFAVAADFVRMFRAEFSFKALMAKIGPIDEAVGFELEGLLGFGISGSLRLYMSGDEIKMSFSGAVSILGLSVSGSAKLSTDGGVVSARLEGSGSLTKVCDVCPALSGKLVVEKAHKDAPVELTMAASASVLGISLSGSVTLSTAALLKSLRLEGDASSLIDFVKEGVLTALGGFALRDQSIVNALNEIVSLLTLRRFRIATREGSVLVSYEFDVMFDGNERTLSFVWPRLPRSVGDLIELVSLSAVQIAKALAPFEYMIAIGDPDRSLSVCLPQLCFCEPYCNRRQMNTLADGNSSSALDPTRVGDRGALTPPHVPGVDGAQAADRPAYSWHLYPGGVEYACDVTGEPHPVGLSADIFQRQVHEEEDAHHEEIEAHLRDSALLRETLKTPTPEEVVVSHGRQGQEEVAKVRERERRLFNCGFSGCCLQLCAQSPLRITTQVKLMITEEITQFQTTVRVQLVPPASIGSWPSFDHSFTATLLLSSGAPTRNLCVLLPQVRDIIEGSKIGGGEFCASTLGFDFCLPLPTLYLKDFISCDDLGF